jgi:hypothetical protein
MVTLQLSPRARGSLWFATLPATLDTRINGAERLPCDRW